MAARQGPQWSPSFHLFHTTGVFLTPQRADDRVARLTQYAVVRVPLGPHVPRLVWPGHGPQKGGGLRSE